MRSTHTYVELPVSEDTWTTIWSKLMDAGYDHAIDEDNFVIDMHGLALTIDPAPPTVSEKQLVQTISSMLARAWPGGFEDQRWSPGHPKHDPTVKPLSGNDRALELTSEILKLVGQVHAKNSVPPKG